MLLTINISRLLFANKPLKWCHSLQLSKLWCHTHVYIGGLLEKWRSCLKENHRGNSLYLYFKTQSILTLFIIYLHDEQQQKQQSLYKEHLEVCYLVLLCFFFKNTFKTIANVHRLLYIKKYLLTNGMVFYFDSVANTLPTFIPRTVAPGVSFYNVLGNVLKT